MQKEDLFNYVMNSPQNTNPAVLKSIIEAVYAGNTPAGGPAGNVVNITNNTSDTIKMGGTALITPEGVTGTSSSRVFISPGISNLFLYCIFSEKDNQYHTGLVVFSDSKGDAYTITVNGTPLLVMDDLYDFTSVADAPITGQTYNVVINYKE